MKRDLFKHYIVISRFGGRGGDSFVFLSQFVLIKQINLQVDYQTGSDFGIKTRGPPLVNCMYPPDTLDSSANIPPSQTKNQKVTVTLPLSKTTSQE